MNRRLLIFVGLGLSLAACDPKGDETGSDDTADADTDGDLDTDVIEDDTGDADTDTDSDTDTEPMVTATMRGTITVEAYLEGPDGREAVDEAAYFGGTFPFGPIFVSATSDNGTSLRYVGSDAVLTPSFTGNTYELTVSMPADGPVGVFASLDQENNLVIETDDPIGVHPDEVDITDGAVFEDVDITILVDAASVGSGSGSGSGSGGDPSCDITIDGDFNITSSSFSTGSLALAMLTTTSGAGPTDFGWVDATASPTGGEGNYSFETCPGQGAMNLVGAFDSNSNGIIDPADIWGAYVSAPDTDGNPVSITTSDLSGYEIQVPIGVGESPLSIVPFVSLTGNVSVQGGTFDDLPAGSAVYVAALKYRPSGTLSTASIESDSYDFEKVEWPDLTGNTSFSYNLGVPAGASVYLWAYADEDVDGLVNETGEAIAPGGGTDGRVETGTTDQSADLELGYVVVDPL